MKDKIVILGHENPDVDSILSGYILCSYLRYKKCDVDYVIPDEKISDDTLEILKKYEIDYLNFPSGISSQSKLILVDHHETKFENEIIAIIDHHPTLKELEYPNCINKPASSTTKLIYDIILEENPQYISKRLVELVLVGAVIDTNSFRSSKALPGDRAWFDKMCEEYGFDSEKMIKMGENLTDISDINKAIINGFKEFTYSKKTVGTSYVQTYGLDESLKDEILKALKNKVKNENYYMWVFIDVNFENETTTVYEVYKKKHVKIKKYDYIASRAINIMPKIEARLSK